jgi:hypothetical protein
LHPVAVGLRFHVDEVADDDAADVPQADLPGDLARRLGLVRRIVFGVLLAGVAPVFTSIEVSAWSAG